jgi:hypothetical protein
MTESEIEILHHNRNRPLILDLGTDADLGITISKERKEELTLRTCAVDHFVTPPDDTKILFKSISQYIDPSRCADSQYVYPPSEVSRVASGLKPGLEKETLKWVLGRGVTEEQVERFGLTDAASLAELEDRIKTGISIHPALQEWIGQEWPGGIVFPTADLNGRVLGTFCRLLSTVPKMKFSAGVPGAYLYTNAGRRYAPKQARGGVIWLVEGVFDGLAADRAGGLFISPSSGFWSFEQLFALDSYLSVISPDEVVCAFDNDRVGSKNNLLATVGLAEYNCTIARYPDRIKDMSELVCKHGLGLDAIGRMNGEEALNHYRSFKYEPLVNYDIYLGNRQASYSNDNYRWNGDRNANQLG